MIDIELRHRLSQDLRRLVTGRMTNDEFDDVYYDFYFDSGDLAVREISRFGWALYSSDLLFPHRLHGKKAVDEAKRKTAAYAVLFLQTNNEYPYPETPESFTGSTLFGRFVGIVIAVIGGLAIIAGLDKVVVPCLLIGALIILLSVLIARDQNKSHDNFRNELGKTGDLRLWPFVDAETVARANGNNYLLSNFKPETLAK